jgi:hypothetical protein
MAVFAGGAVCASLVAGTLRVLRGPLLTVLNELCAATARARFWWRLLSIEVVAGSALCTSLGSAGQAGEAWRTAVAMVSGASAGLLVSLTTVVAAVLAFQRDVDRSRRARSI